MSKLIFIVYKELIILIELDEAIRKSILRTVYF